MIFLGNMPDIDYADQTKEQIKCTFPKIVFPRETELFLKEKILVKKPKKDYSQLFSEKLIEANKRGT